MSTNMEKQAFQAIPGFLKLLGGSALKLADDFIGGSYRWTTGGLTKVLRPRGASINQKTFKLRYRRPDGELKGWRDNLGNIFGTAYNNSRFFRNWAHKLNRSGIKDLNTAFPNAKPGRAVGKGLRYLGYGGIGGGILEIPFSMMGEDSTGYKVVHGLNSLNPLYWAAMHPKSPANLLFNYTTPAGLAMTGLSNMAENIGKMSAQQGATMAINSTADALSNLKFTDRLGFLLSPQAAADKYKAQAMDQLAQNMAQMRGE